MHLVVDLRVRVEFCYRYHAQLLTGFRKEIIQQKGQEVEEAFSAAVGRLLLTEIRHLRRGRKTREWLSVV